MHYLSVCWSKTRRTADSMCSAQCIITKWTDNRAPTQKTNSWHLRSLPWAPGSQDFQSPISCDLCVHRLVLPTFQLHVNETIHYIHFCIWPWSLTCVRFICAVSCEEPGQTSGLHAETAGLLSSVLLPALPPTPITANTLVCMSHQQNHSKNINTRKVAQQNYWLCNCPGSVPSTNTKPSVDVQQYRL